MLCYSRAFLTDDIEQRRKRLKHTFDKVLLELGAADRTIGESTPVTASSEHLILIQHAEIAKDELAKATADFESLADLIRSLHRCDC